jgi:hypothetical protein
MAKPIAILYVPEDGRGIGAFHSDLMRELNGIENDTYVRTDFWAEYYWLVIYKDDIREPELKVFYEKDFTEIKLNELKEIVLNHIKDYEQRKNSQSGL